MSEIDEYTEVATALREMQIKASKSDTKKCINGEYMVYLPYDRAIIPGHIYSEMGLDEARMSGWCEYHFDRYFQRGWVDVITGEKGDTPDE